MDWKQTLGNLAPTIGAAFGPLGAAGGLAVRELLGLSKDSSDDDLAAFIQTPDGALKLKQAEYDYKTKMAQIQLENDKSLDDDRKSARERDLELKKSGYTNRRADIMIIVITISLIVDVYLIATQVQMKPEVLAIFNMLIGASIKMLSDAFQFEFGSSRGSKEKDYYNSKP